MQREVIMETRKRLRDEEDFDPDEALTAAVKKRKFLLRRMLEDRQYNFNEKTMTQRVVQWHHPHHPSQNPHSVYYLQVICIGGNNSRKRQKGMIYLVITV